MIKISNIFPIHYIFFFFSDIEYLKQTLPETIEPEFFVFLRQLTAKDVVLYAIDEGSVAFPRYVISINV